MSKEKKEASLCPPFHLMAKPAGPACNLRCTYCFYTEKAALWPQASANRMPDDVLEAYIRLRAATQHGPTLDFAWQGGEPTLAGLPFFEHAASLQRRHAGGRGVSNSLQTNGTLLDDAWCAFLAENRFLVGLSLDGPGDVHDRYRKDAVGKGSFECALKAVRLLRKHGVEYNILCSVTRESARQPREVYRFIKSTGTRFVQFIPIVERAPDTAARGMGMRLAEPHCATNGAGATRIMPWSVNPKDYGAFLCAVFDEWVRHDVGRIFVQLFDVALGAWMNMPASLCCFAARCGNAMVLEWNGDVYACDHYVYPDYLLGNILRDDPRDLAQSPRLQALGAAKQTALPSPCRTCRWLFACRGECPKNRFAATPSGEKGLNYLCPAYRAFFKHADPWLRHMKLLLSEGHPADEVRAIVRRHDFERLSGASGRNAPCPCGSGHKYKACCGGARPC